MLNISNLSKKINNTLIVNDISFSIEKGKILGLLGPNGAGKTTTMKMILGLTSKTSGSVTINNKSLDSQFESAISNVGAIIETPKFYPFLSGFQNLKYFSSLNKYTDNHEVKEILEYFDLGLDAKKKVKHYSLGMKQRLGIAQATLHRPTLLILDEPFNGLDPHALKIMRQYLRKLSLNGTSILISSHIISEIELLCDDIVVMKKGALIGEFKVNEKPIISSSLLVSIHVDDIEKAVLLINKYFKLICCIDKKALQFRTNKDTIPIILKRLLNEGINVYETIHKKESVEDKFMEIIGGDIIA